MWKIIVSYLLAKWGAFIACVRKNASVIIALLALIVSICSMHLLRQDFIATHRPYVYAISKETDPNTVFISCFNAPARIISEEFYYLVVKTKENGEEDINQIYKHEFPSGNILYPYVPPTRRLTILYDVKKKALELDPRIIRRKVKIDYKEISSDRTYFFEGNWDYNSVHDLWEDKDKFGN
jgi:hypothetical protein